MTFLGHWSCLDRCEERRTHSQGRGRSSTLQFNKSLKQSECESVDCKTIETIVPISPKLIVGCNFHNSINENEKYLKDIDCEFMTSSFDLKETIFNLNENNIEKSSSNEEKEKEIETSS